MTYSNYENSRKSCHFLEKGIDDIAVLDKVFREFMDDDDMTLLDDKIDSIN